MRRVVGLALIALLHTPTSSAADCFSDLDCSLNGQCYTASSPYLCHCDPGWTGTHCSILDLSPASHNTGYNHTSFTSPSFYRQNGNSSWCGEILHDPSDPRLFHLFASQLSFGCGLAGWRPFSTIIRAESRTGPRGPFIWAQEVFGGFHHNPTVKWSASQEQALLYFIGRDVDLPATCKSSKFANTISVSASKDLKSWTEPVAVLENMTNPAPWVLSRSGIRGEEVLLAVEGNDVFRADDYAGPYERVATPDFANRTEDPFLWQDKRGNWHLIMHNMIDIEEFKRRKYPRVGAHAFAEEFEGPWMFSEEVTFTTTIEFDDGPSVEYYRRERPKLFFSEDGEMTPLYLVSGVQEFNKSTSYTLIQPVGTKWREYEKELGF